MGLRGGNFGRMGLQRTTDGLAESLGNSAAGARAEESCPVLHETAVDYFSLSLGRLGCGAENAQSSGLALRQECTDCG